MSKALKKITKPFSKAIGSITGTNAAKAAAKDQARQLENQANQERQATIQQVAASRDAALANQQSIESNIARDTANQAAQEQMRAAQADAGAQVDLEGSGSGGGDTDAEGRRVGTREKFMGRASSSLRL